MSLRTRLLIALLGVGLIPTLLVALLAVFQLNLAMAPWFRPGIDRALDAALQTTQISLTRFESTVLAQSEEWAARWPAGPPSAERTAMRRELQATGLDFVQVYQRAGSGWTLEEHLIPASVLLTEDLDLAAELDSALAGSPLLHSPRGAIAAVAPLRDGRALVAGIRVPPDFFAEIRMVADGVTFYGRSTVYGPLERMSHWFIVAAVLLLVGALAALIANAIARETARPLRELSGATERVAAGDLAVRVEPRGAHELRDLGRSFNTMTERLRAAREAAQQAEREAAWRDAARKLAHEFKNILTPIKLSLQRLEERVPDLPVERRETTARSVARALGEVESLERLSSQFHQYARMPEPQIETLDIGEILRGIADQAPACQLHMTTSGVAGVRGDRVLLSRAVHNLVLNAIEAGTADAPIEIHVRSAADHVFVDILDRGAGLPADLRSRLFDPYVSTKKRGSGLGLALVRDIARQHGGSVALEDREGGGTHATLTLPAATAKENV